MLSSKKFYSLTIYYAFINTPRRYRFFNDSCGNLTPDILVLFAAVPTDPLQILPGFFLWPCLCLCRDYALIDVLIVCCICCVPLLGPSEAAKQKKCYIDI